MKYRCAILDDYQNVALSYADWSKLAGDVEVKVFNEPFKNKEEVHRALQGFQIIAMMR
jgi:D-3-phosphoglycerate dehydrogenase